MHLAHMVLDPTGTRTSSDSPVLTAAPPRQVTGTLLAAPHRCVVAT